METRGDRIKRLREQAKLTQEQLAKLAGISGAAVSDYEKNKYQPKVSTCNQIAKALNLPPDAILDMPPGSGYDNPQPYLTKKLPMLGEIPCGLPTVEWEVIEWVDVLIEDWGPNRYVLRANGDSMSPKIESHDLVIIENGGAITLEQADHKICALEYDGEKTLKYVDVEWRGGNPLKVILRPRNEKYKHIEIVGEKLDRLRICGIALSIKRYL